MLPEAAADPLSAVAEPDANSERAEGSEVDAIPLSIALLLGALFLGSC